MPKPFRTRGLQRLKKARKHESQQPSRNVPWRKWYFSAEWRAVRKRHLAKNPFCVECLKMGKGEAASIPVSPHVDHVQAHKGDWGLFLAESNLETLCHSHHSEKTARQDGGFGNG